jgi:hypothetical protein
MSQEKVTSLQFVVANGKKEIPRNRFLFVFNRVMGIITPDTFLRDRDYDMMGAYCLQNHALPTHTARGIVAFFADYYTDRQPSESDERITPSHSLLVRMVHEGEAADRTRTDLEEYALEPHRNLPLEPGQTYVLGTNEQPRFQGVIGLDHSQRSLTVLGSRGILLLSHNTNLRQAMGATTVHEICPPAPPAKNPS